MSSSELFINYFIKLDWFTNLFCDNVIHQNLVALSLLQLWKLNYTYAHILDMSYCNKISVYYEFTVMITKINIAHSLHDFSERPKQSDKNNNNKQYRVLFHRHNLHFIYEISNVCHLTVQISHIKPLDHTLIVT